MNGKFQNLLVAQSLKLISCIHGNPKEVSSNDSEEMDLLARGGQAGQVLKLPSSVSLYKLPEESMAQIKGLSSHLEIWIKGISLSTSRSELKAYVFQL